MAGLNRYSGRTRATVSSTMEDLIKQRKTPSNREKSSRPRALTDRVRLNAFPDTMKFLWKLGISDEG